MSSVSITVQSAVYPLVLISTSAVMHFNADTQLVLSASVQLSAAGISTWSVSDSSITMATASSTPVSQVLPQGLSIITLIMNPNSLIPGQTLTFTLSAVTSASTGDNRMFVMQLCDQMQCVNTQTSISPYDHQSSIYLCILMIIFSSALKQIKS